jgi:hypothetical protein
MARTAALLPTTLYTLSDLERRTRVRRRILQIWGDSGVIVPSGATAHAGKGNPRRFPASEAIIAVLVKPLADANIQIGHLAFLAGAVRDGLGFPPPPIAEGTAERIPPALRGRFPSGVQYRQGIAPIEHALSRALRGEGENFLLLAYNNVGDFRIRALEEDDPASPPPSRVADFFSRGWGAGSWGRERPNMAFCLDLQRLAGIFDEDLPG